VRARRAIRALGGPLSAPLVGELWELEDSCVSRFWRRQGLGGIGPGEVALHLCEIAHGCGQRRQLSSLLTRRGGITRIPRFHMNAELVARLRRYAAEVRQSREELSESTREQALPPIPRGDHHRKRAGRTGRAR